MFSHLYRFIYIFLPNQIASPVFSYKSMESQKALCQICQKPESLFKGVVSCSNHHVYHKACLKNCFESMYSYTFIGDCNACIMELLSNYKKSSKCIKCKDLLGSMLNNCKLHKHMCDACMLTHLEKKHYEECQDCRRMFIDVRMCMKCFKMFRSNELVQSSRCNVHFICKYCVNLVNISELTCENCKSSFQSQSIYPKKLCVLCGINVNSQALQCESGHFYCDLCLEIYTYSKDHCRNCVQILEQATEAHEAEMKRSRESQDSNSFPTTVRIGEATNQNRCMICNKAHKLGLFNTPRCNSHVFCSKCLNTKYSIKCEECSKYFNMINTIDDPTRIVCNLCQSALEDTTPFCTSKHMYCTKCSNALKSKSKICYLRVLNCRNCIKRINTEFVRNKNSSFVETQKVVLPPETNLTFNCGHTFAYKNICRTYISLLKSFVQDLETNNPGNIPENFPMKCLDKACGQYARIPFVLVWNGILRKFNGKQRKLIRKFEFYFDGGKFYFEMCACLRVVAKNGQFYINCYCSN